MKEKYIILRHSAKLQSELSRSRIEVDEIDSNTIENLKSDNTVIDVVPSIPMKLITHVKTNTVDISNTVEKITWGIKAIGADTSPFTGEGIVVAVLDSGINASHPAFSGVEIIEKDFTNEGHGDEIGHGTQVAGTIFGRDINEMRIGVATGVKKALIGKVFGNNNNNTEQIITAMDWAVENGANVISISLGFDFPEYVKFLEESKKYPHELAISFALQAYYKNIKFFETTTAYIQQRTKSAVIIVAAAGNESRREGTPVLKIPVGPPGIVENIIAVGAISQGEKDFKIAPFSNTGSEVCAPGVGIITASVDGGVISCDGTSMATPHVAGVAALWAEKLQRNKQLTSDILTNRLQGRAITNRLEQFNSNDFGSGLVHAPQD